MRLEAELAGEAVVHQAHRDGAGPRRVVADLGAVIAVDLEDLVQDLAHRMAGPGTDVDCEIGPISGEGRQQAVDEIIDVDQIANVPAVAPDLERAVALDNPADEGRCDM